MNMSNLEEIKSSEFSSLPTLKDPKGCPNITPNHQQDDDIKKIKILRPMQDSKGCSDITPDHQKDDDIKSEPVILQQDSKGCPDIAVQDRTEYGVVNETVILLKEEEPKDDDDGFKTPTSLESKIPVMTTCPPAPKRKASVSPRRGKRTIRVWHDYRHRDSGRFWPENQESNNNNSSRRRAAMQPRLNSVLEQLNFYR
ncbi:hypothetical protein A4A49_13773 [Nicotiana attenuata]|uniref:Uncharacterized protein n=1 Tax=Nicotiana attenuata TaxID=49451 RepID=A0A314KZH9_NICAT|nr:hypothetical protein A4A49_13773 [Nicotiana attenuata]